MYCKGLHFLLKNTRPYSFCLLRSWHALMAQTYTRNQLNAVNAIPRELTVLHPIRNARLELLVLVCSTSNMSEHGELPVRTDSTPSTRTLVLVCSTSNMSEHGGLPVRTDSTPSTRTRGTKTWSGRMWNTPDVTYLVMRQLGVGADSMSYIIWCNPSTAICTKLNYCNITTLTQKFCPWHEQCMYIRC